jgi:hypothetical protein
VDGPQAMRGSRWRRTLLPISDDVSEYCAATAKLGPTGTMQRSTGHLHAGDWIQIATCSVARSDQSHPIHVFPRKVGIAPGQWRRSLN